MDMTVSPHPLLDDGLNCALLKSIEHGLPLVPEPYKQIGRQLGITENTVIERLRQLQEQGIIKRLGIVVRHRALGYRSNAMVVWDIPDDKVAATGSRLASIPFITLCYRRPRRLPDWPYNLFTMIHGRDRQQVLARVDHLVARCGMQGINHLALFSPRCFKQCGARYTSLDTRMNITP